MRPTPHVDESLTPTGLRAFYSRQLTTTNHEAASREGRLMAFTNDDQENFKC